MPVFTRDISEYDHAAGSFMEFSVNYCASHPEQGFESSMVHHTRKLVINFPSVPPLSARTRLSFVADRVSAEPYFIEAAALPCFVSGPRKYFLNPLVAIRAGGANSRASRKHDAQFARYVDQKCNKVGGIAAW